MTETKFSKSAPFLGGMAKLSLACFARLPIGMAQRLGAGLGHLVWLLPNRLRTSSTRNIDLCLPELTAAERRQLARRSLIEMGKSYAELGALWSWPTERLAELEEGVENEELFEGCLDADRGLILLAPHIGNWEFFNHFLMLRRPFMALYRQVRVRELEPVLRRARERTGCRMAPANRVGLRMIHRELAGGGVVFILPDQEPLKKQGIFSPFFGVPALTMTLVARLCQSLDSRVLYAFAERQLGGRFRVHFRPGPEGLDDPDLQVAVARMNRGVEDCVRACPEQYLWSYRRFRTRPPEELAVATSASLERFR